MLKVYHGNGHRLVSDFVKDVADAQSGVKSTDIKPTRVIYNNHVTMGYNPVFHIHFYMSFCAIARVNLPLGSMHVQSKVQITPQTL